MYGGMYGGMYDQFGDGDQYTGYCDCGCYPDFVDVLTHSHWGPDGWYSGEAYCVDDWDSYLGECCDANGGCSPGTFDNQEGDCHGERSRLQ